ncbi:hypothetical protein GCM10017044_02420 [Kordiimonas sediminis]|uniref:Uncharacterized protein n=1 Tax=Kordiimonas sediminis TaxID=1735581 RepID=A0A919E268_9PROT|nr:hypothetical protein [Kordiimonas sediminis]GHF12053.1 hypothetical protein GCM10017044_02420 [Kordiimonas sediminis]
MALGLDGLAGMADGPRMLYRSAHIYFLFGCLLNLFLAGSYDLRVTDEDRGRFAALHILITLARSGLILLSPLLAVSSFFLESASTPDLDRLLASFSAFAALGGGIMIVAAAVIDRISRT